MKARPCVFLTFGGFLGRILVRIWHKNNTNPMGKANAYSAVSIMWSTSDVEWFSRPEDRFSGNTLST